MKAGLPILRCIAVAIATTTVGTSEPGSMRARLLEELKVEFTYQPTPVDRDRAAAQQDSEGAVVLPDYHVVEDPRDPTRAIREYRDILEREDFTWRHGGTIKRLERLPFRPALMWKYNPEHDGIDLLSFSW
jgi:hypothetical protein